MINFNLRVTTDSLEIITTLNKMFIDQSRVLVWQNLGNVVSCIMLLLVT